MLEKVAKVRALREAFVEDLAGMYEAEEVNVDLPEMKEEMIIKQDDVIDAEIIEGDIEEVDMNEL